MEEKDKAEWPVTKRVFRGREGGGGGGGGNYYYLLLFVLKFQPGREGVKTLSFFVDIVIP